jgi:hypothetical protein
VILGAVHWLPDHLPADTPAEFEKSFMRVTEQLVTRGIHVLAHPFRIFHQATGWQSVGSFILSKDRRTADTADQMVLLNDPNCPEYVAIYAGRWKRGNSCWRPSKTRVQFT